MTAIEHSISNLSALAHAPNPTREFHLGTPHRTPALLTNSPLKRLTAVQKDCRDATVYYVCDKDYIAAYKSHHHNHLPSPNNISFVLPARGAVIVRVHDDCNNASPLSLDKGTALITVRHHMLLEEAVKHGLSELRGIRQGMNQLGIEERRKRIREGRLVDPTREACLEQSSTTPAKLYCKTYTKGVSMSEVIIEIPATALTYHGSTIYLADSKNFQKIPNRLSLPVVSINDPEKGEVFVINQDRLSSMMPSIRSTLKELSPSEPLCKIIEVLEHKVITDLTADIQQKLGDKAFEILLATLQRHRIDPLPPHRLQEALTDVARASPLDHSAVVELIRETSFYMGEIDERMNTTDAVDDFERTLGSLTLTPSSRYSKKSREVQRALIHSRSLQNDEERIETARRSLFSPTIRSKDTQSILVDYIDRLGHDVCDSTPFTEEIRRAAPSAITPPTDGDATTKLQRNEFNDPRGPYIQTEFAPFATTITLRDGSVQHCRCEVRWHTPTQTYYRELPGFRVSLLLTDGSRYELTSIKPTLRPDQVREGECFVSNADNVRSLFVRHGTELRNLGSLSDLGLLETQDGYVYSKSDFLLDASGNKIPIAISSAGKALPYISNEIMKDTWHLPYIPQRMDISI